MSMKRLLLNTFILVKAISLLILLQSCCEEKLRIYNNGEFKAIPLESTTDNGLDTIIGPFQLLARFDVQHVEHHDFSPFSSAYATRCAERYLNQLEKNSIQLTCNKNFLYRGDTIRMDSNLVRIAEIKQKDYGYFAYWSFVFNDAFLQRAQFEKESYRFTIKAVTNDGVQLENKTTLFMNL